MNNPALNWCYYTAPDPELNARSIYWPRGKLIGGSSSLNAMAYMRGLAHDFDDWERAGASGWHWDNVRSIYERLETHMDITTAGSVRRGNGPVWVSDLSDQMNPFSRNFLDAAKEVGHPVINDLNALDFHGVGYYRSTVRNGYRWSSADAFLKSAKHRSN